MCSSQQLLYMCRVYLHRWQAHLALKLALISITACPRPRHRPRHRPRPSPLHSRPLSRLPAAAAPADVLDSATITMIKRFLWLCYSFAGVDYSWFFRMQYGYEFVCSGHLNFMNFIQLCCLHTDDAAKWLIIYFLVDFCMHYLAVRPSVHLLIQLYTSILYSIWILFTLSLPVPSMDDIHSTTGV